MEGVLTFIIDYTRQIMYIIYSIYHRMYPISNVKYSMLEVLLLSCEPDSTFIIGRKTITQYIYSNFSIPSA